MSPVGSPGGADEAPERRGVELRPAVELTPDGRHVVIKGRRWRATDPSIPDDVAAELRHELMSARRAVGAALRSRDPEGERFARARVHRAKTALGERGTPWWEQDADQRRARWESGLAGGGGRQPGDRC